MAVKEIVTKLTLDNSSVKKGLSDTEKTLLKFTAVVGGITAAMAGAAVVTAKWQDEMIKASRSAGASVETFSALSIAAEKSNVSTEDLAKSLGKLNTQAPDTAKNLAAVGISVKDANGHFKTTEVLLGDVADQMAKYKNPANQAMVATKVFGEEGGKLVNMLKDGKAGLEAARKEAEKYGLVVSEQAGVAAEKFNDDMVETKNALKGLTASIGESIIAWTNQGGIMNVVRDTIAGVTQWWRSLSDETKNVIITTGAIITGLAGLLAAIIAINAILPTLKAGLATAFGPVGIAVMALTAAIAGFVKFLSDYGAAAKAIFKPIADAANTAWQALKGLGAAITKIFVDVDDTNVQEALKRTGKNMGEAQKGASAFAYVFAGLSATVSSVFQTVAQIFNQISISLTRVIEQIQAFGAMTKAAVSGNTQAAAEELKKLQQAQLTYFKNSNAGYKQLGEGIIKVSKEVANLKPPPLKFDTAKVKKTMEDTVKIAEKTTTALGVDITQKTVQTVNGVNDGVTKFNNSILTMADRTKKVVTEIVGYMGGIGDAMKAVTNVITSNSKYQTQIQLRDLEVQTIRSKKAFEEMRASAEAEEAAKTAALEKSYDDQIQALKDAEAEKTAAIEFESKQRLLLNDQEYQTAKAQAEAAHAAFMEAERVRFEEEKALMAERTVDKEQRRLNEGVMDANYQAYVKAQEALFQQQLTDLAKNSGDKKTKIDSETKAKITADTKANAEQIKLLEAAKAAALQKNEEDKNKRMAAIDAARTDQEKAEEKRRLQIQYDAELQDFEQNKAVKITDVIVSGISAAANAFAALAPIPFVGFGLGLAAAAAITGATIASVAQINSQRPVKPAALIAEDGGLARGQRHSGGGILTEVEDGELITSRGRTRALFDAIDSGTIGGGGGVVVNIGEINAVASDSQGLADLISDMITEKVGTEIRRLGFMGA